MKRIKIKKRKEGKSMQLLFQLRKDLMIFKNSNNNSKENENKEKLNKKELDFKNKQRKESNKKKEIEQLKNNNRE